MLSLINNALSPTIIMFKTNISLQNFVCKWKRNTRNYSIKIPSEREASEEKIEKTAYFWHS